MWPVVGGKADVVYRTTMPHPPDTYERPLRDVFWNDDRELRYGSHPFSVAHWRFIAGSGLPRRVPPRCFLRAFHRAIPSHDPVRFSGQFSSLAGLRDINRGGGFVAFRPSRGSVAAALRHSPRKMRAGG